MRQGAQDGLGPVDVGLHVGIEITSEKHARDVNRRLDMRNVGPAARVGGEGREARGVHFFCGELAAQFSRVPHGRVDVPAAAERPQQIIAPYEPRCTSEKKNHISDYC